MPQGHEYVDAPPLEFDRLPADALDLVQEDDLPGAGQVLGVRGHKADDPNLGAVLQGMDDATLVGVRQVILNEP